MRSVIILLAVIAAGLCVTAAAVAGGDRQTLVPPPDAVAEGFARAVTERRYEVATRYLSQRLQEGVGGDRLRSWFEPVRRRLGETNLIEGELESMDDARASARALVDSEYGTALLQLRMVRESGLWTIDELPADVPVGVRQ
jgi:hypothetical protein